MNATRGEGRPATGALQSPMAAYSWTLFSVAAAAGLRWLLDPLFGDNQPYPTFYLAVVASAWIGGLRTGLLATGLGLLVSWYCFVPPRLTFLETPGRHLVGLAMYLAVSLGIALVGESLRLSRRARRQAVLSEKNWPMAFLSQGERSLRNPGRGDFAFVGFLLTLAVLGVGALLGYFHTRRLIANDRMVEHTHVVLAELETLLSTLKDAETGQRGYLLTEDEKYLEPYSDAIKRVEEAVLRLEKLTADNLGQQARLGILGEQIALKMDELKRTVALMKGGDRPSAMQIVRSNTGKALMDDVRESVLVLQQSEHELLRRRAEESEASSRISIWSVLLPAGIGGVLLAVLFHLSRRSLRLRQEALEAIAEQRERLRVTLASIGDAVIVTDADARVTFLNAAAESLTGWTQQESTGLELEAVFRIVNEETRRSLENPAKKALRVGRIVGPPNQTILLRRDGTELPIDENASPIQDHQGRIVGAILVFRDISERRRSEMALAASGVRFQLAVEAVNCVLCEHDLLTGKVERTRGLSEVLGYGSEEAPPTAAWWLEQVHADDRQAYLQHREAAVKSGQSMFSEYRLLHRDGRWLRMEERGVLVKDSAGKPVKMVTCAMDVTARRSVEESLRYQMDLVRNITDNATTAIFMTDTEGRATFLNPAAEAMTGHAFKEVEGLQLDDFIHQQLADGTESPLTGGPIRQSLTGTSVLRNHEAVFVRKNGEVFPVLCNARPVQKNGVTVGTVLEIRDITQEKENENRVHALLTELRDADRRKDEFLATLAHELRNPLAPVRNSIEVMKLASGNAALLDQARTTMDRQVGHMVRLIDDLLDVSRITRNKLDLRKERVELASIIHHAIESCRPLIESAGHVLTVTLPTEPTYLHADPVRLAQVFGNILTNACKYTEEGGSIWLSVERQDSTVVVTIRDSGIGIPPEMLPRVFGLFTQIDRSLERSQGGLGIGLALVKRLVEMHEGSVTANSPGPGQGSEFVVRLPILAGQPVSPVLPLPLVGAAPTTSRRVLVVDDNIDSATTLAMLLKLTGNDAQTVHNGIDALEKAATYKPDMILLDIGLPGLNGYQVCRAIREKPWGKAMLIVAMTGWGQEEDRRKSRESGFDAHLVKPVDHSTVLRLLGDSGRPQA